MARPKPSGDSRIHCRVSPALKQKVETAARLCGQSVTAFTELALEERARQVLLEQEQILLSQSAFEAFRASLQALPDPPSRKLLAAVQSYKRKSK